VSTSTAATVAVFPPRCHRETRSLERVTLARQREADEDPVRGDRDPPPRVAARQAREARRFAPSPTRSTARGAASPPAPAPPNGPNIPADGKGSDVPEGLHACSSLTTIRTS
jgi:hypothetical protein